MCQGRTAKDTPCKNKNQKGDIFCKIHRKQADAPPPRDNYTKDILFTRIKMHFYTVSELKKFRDDAGLPIRLPNFPEDVSENMAKFIIHFHVGDTTSKWTKCIRKKGENLPGDLRSEVESIQEVKAFTSAGPTTFGPKTVWNVIYFLDARDWLSDKYILWRCSIPKPSDKWKSLDLSKKETEEAKTGKGNRPHIKWTSLYPQIKDYTTKIFEGSLEDIFRPAKAPVGQQSASPLEQIPRSLPACTDESLPGPEACSLEEIPGN